MRARLEAGDRELLSLVSRAAFENPFGDERARLDRLAAGSGGEPDVVDRLLERLRGRLATLAGEGELDVRAFDGEDAVLVEHAVLFDVFHRFAGPMDELIERQAHAREQPLVVPFARELLGELAGAGLAAPRARRMLELFYQMRRAFTLVGRGLVGSSPSVRRLRAALWNAIFTRDIRRYDRFLWDRMEDFSTILVGETGTGKGAAAAAIGRSGFIAFDERAGTFRESFATQLVPINLSEFPETLIESELFGHRKGAFTGAVESHEGLLSRCGPHGAILLDEIGEVSIPVQVKLLRLLQDRVFRPVGSREEQRFEGRVIAATHRDLDALRREGLFRDDFYYRLSTCVVEMPTLRARLAEEPSELDALLGHLVERIVGERSEELVAEVAEAIDRDLGPDHPWPGNVRELEQTIRSVLLTGRCPARPTGGGDGLAEAVRAGELAADELVADYCRALYARHGTYVEVARITGLDRRTVRKHVAGSE